MSGWFDGFTGKAQKQHIQQGIDAANADLAKQTGAINDASGKYQAGFQPYVQGGQQDYATYRNALANGTGGPGGFDQRYFDPEGPLNQARQIDIDRQRRLSNAGGNYGGADGGRSGIGALADSRVNYQNYYGAQQDWLNRQKGMVDLGYGATRDSGSGYMQSAGLLSGAYGQNADRLMKGYGDMAENDSTGLKNSLAVAGTVAKFIPGAGGAGGINYGNNNLGKYFPAGNGSFGAAG
jgi:hypothetical protein